jgi:hypothetical protein
MIQMEFAAAPGPLPAGVHQLTVENRHLPGISAYLLNAARPGSDLVRIDRQDRNEDQSAGEIEFAVDPPANSSRLGRIAASVALLFVAVFAPAWRARKGSPRRHE